MQGASWLLQAPQFWLGFATCAAFILAVVAITDLFGARQRTIKVYRVSDPASTGSYYHDRAPIPTVDPFCKRPPYGSPHRRRKLATHPPDLLGHALKRLKKRP